MQYSALTTPGVVRFVEAETPRDLAARVRQAYDELVALVGPTAVLYLLNLAGGGDGHTFVAEIGATTAANAPDGISNPAFVCYQAATALDLPAARQNAINQFPFHNGLTIDEQVAGASQGTKFMGIMLMPLLLL